MIYTVKLSKRIGKENVKFENKYFNIPNIEEFTSRTIKTIEDKNVLKFLKRFEDPKGLNKLLPDGLRELFLENNYQLVKCLIKRSKFKLKRPADNFRKLIQHFIDNYEGGFICDSFSNSVFFTEYGTQLHVKLSRNNLFIHEKLYIKDFNKEKEYNIPELYNKIIGDKNEL